MTKPPKPTRPEKKSEMLDVRLPYGMKQALVEACRKQGVTVSDTVRGLFSEYVSAAQAGETQPKLKGIAMKIAKNPRKTLGMTLAAALSAVVFLAQPSVADDALFESFDTNEDGVIDADEMDREALIMIDRDHNDKIEPDEFLPELTTRETRDEILETGSGERTREIAFTIRELKLVQGGEEAETHLNTFSCSTSIALEASADDMQAEIADLTAKCERGLKAHLKD